MLELGSDQTSFFTICTVTKGKTEWSRLMNEVWDDQSHKILASFVTIKNWKHEALGWTTGPPSTASLPRQEDHCRRDKGLAKTITRSFGRGNRVIMTAVYTATTIQKNNNSNACSAITFSWSLRTNAVCVSRLQLTWKLKGVALLLVPQLSRGIWRLKIQGMSITQGKLHTGAC
jgi:hypothetical protein